MTRQGTTAVTFTIAALGVFATTSVILGTILKVTLILTGYGDALGWRGAFFAGLGYTIFRTIDRVAWSTQKSSDTPI